MDAEEYLSERLQDQIDWHSAKSAANQRRYKQLQIVVIVASALLPLFAVLEDEAGGLTYAIGGIGVLVAALTGLASLYRFNELWIDYRLTAESLTQEKYRFLTGTAPYHEGDGLATLVERVEAILSDQNARWQQVIGATAPTPEGRPEGNEKPPA